MHVCGYGCVCEIPDKMYVLVQQVLYGCTYQCGFSKWMYVWCTSLSLFGKLYRTLLMRNECNNTQYCCPRTRTYIVLKLNFVYRFCASQTPPVWVKWQSHNPITFEFICIRRRRVFSLYSAGFELLGRE